MRHVPPLSAQLFGTTQHGVGYYACIAVRFTTCLSRAMSSIQSAGDGCALPPSTSGNSDAAKLLDSEGSSCASSSMMDDVSDSMGDGIDVEDPMEDSGGCVEDLLSDSPPEPHAGAPDDASMDAEGLLSSSGDSEHEHVPLVLRQQRQTDSLGPEK